MKIRTLNDLSDRIDRETGWRKVELSTLLMDVKGTTGSAGVLALRAGIDIVRALGELDRSNLASIGSSSVIASFRSTVQNRSSPSAIHRRD